MTKKCPATFQQAWPLLVQVMLVFDGAPWWPGGAPFIPIVWTVQTDPFSCFLILLPLQSQEEEQTLEPQDPQWRGQL